MWHKKRNHRQDYPSQQPAIWKLKDNDIAIFVFPDFVPYYIVGSVVWHRSSLHPSHMTCNQNVIQACGFDHGQVHSNGRFRATGCV